MAEMTTTVMTREEAETTNRLIKHYVRNARLLLLEMRDRKGWKALGYRSFEEYGEKEHGYGHAYIYRLAQVAEITLQISTIVEKPETIPASQIIPLAKVDPESRAEVWQAAQERADAKNDGKCTARIVEEAVAEWRAKFEAEHHRRLDAEGRAASKEKLLNVALAKLDAKPEPVERLVEVPPPDYDDTRRRAERATQLQTELERAQAQLTEITAEIGRRTEAAIRRGFQDRQAELDQLEQRKEALERMVTARLDRFSRFNATLDASQEIADECAKLAVAFGGFAATVCSHELSGLDPRARAQAERVRHLIDGAARALDGLLSLPDLPREYEVREAP